MKLVWEVDGEVSQLFCGNARLGGVIPLEEGEWLVSENVVFRQHPYPTCLFDTEEAAKEALERLVQLWFSGLEEVDR